MKKKYLLEYSILSFVLLIITILYLKTTNPVFINDDSPETAIAAYTLGISHPPGYPLFSMCAKIATLVPLASPAFRVNLFSSLLAICVLLITYFIVKNYVLNLLIKDGFWGKRIFSLIIVLMLALSYIFWDQGIEAKGGIYMLNLLFVSIIIYCCLNIFKNPKLKYFYLISFAFSLALANHWMSIIILAPVLIFVIVSYRDNLKVKGFIIFSLFFLAGLSAYLYLPIRANAGPDLNIGNPKTMHDFLWVVLRNLYQYPVKTNPDVYANQIIVFLKFFFTNYSLFILFGFIGLRTMLKTERKSAWFLLSVFLLYIIVVVPYTRTIKGIFILENILLIPAEYVCVLFIASGMFHIFSKARENKIYIYGFIALTAGLFGFMSFRHYEINNHSEDYITYDLGKSILNTMEKDSVYFGDGDYNIMPVYYLQQMNNEKSDIKLVASMFINYQWGIDNFTKKYGSISISPMNLGDNIRIVIDSFVNKANIYRSSLYPKFDEIDLPYKQLQKGLLIKITPENEMFSSEIFDIYCYRGIFNKFCQSDQAKLDIITWYAKGMVNQGNDLNNSGKLTEALKLYERALLFPVKKPEADIYYSMSIAYSKLQDVENELVCLEKSIQENNNYLPALEKAGVIYYERKILPMAGNMFDRAVMAGSKSDYILNAAKHISTMNFTDQCEYGFIKANEYLLKNDVKKAMYIYNFLIGNNYKTGIIQANIGNFYFNNDNYPEALRWLLKSQNSMKSPGMVYCIAYSYYRIKDIKSALRVLEEGLKTYNEDQRLKTFYSQLKHI